MNTEDENYFLTIEDCDGYSHAKLTGKDTLTNSLSFWKEIIDYCSQNKVLKMFLEEDMEGELTVTELYHVISAIPTMNNDVKNTKLAFFDTHISHFDGNIFGETLAVNRGLYAKVFDDEEKAFEWLGVKRLEIKK